MTRRTTKTAALLAVLLAAVVSTTTLAATPFRYTVLRDVCELGGGDHGFGFLKLKVRVKEIGTSGAEFFRIRSKVQMKTESPGWKTIQDWGWEYSDDFPNNSTSYYHDLSRRYDPDGAFGNALAFRIWFRVQVWRFNELLDQKVVIGQKCVTGLP